MGPGNGDGDWVEWGMVIGMGTWGMGNRRYLMGKGDRDGDTGNGRGDGIRDRGWEWDQGWGGMGDGN